MCDWCGSVIISIKRIDVWLCVVVFMISFRCSIIFSFYTSHVHGTVKCMHFLTFFGCFASVFFITCSLKIDERLLNPFSQACDIVESKNIEHQFCISFILRSIYIPLQLMKYEISLKLRWRSLKYLIVYFMDNNSEA